MFVHIGPEETETIRRIPRALLFPAPGRPKGHFVLGYDERGHCPMLVDERCSIYDHRPRTCREYDCRVFAATGVVPDQPDIAQRAAEWEFEHDTGECHRAAEFLREKRLVPRNPADFAMLAVKVSKLFAEGRSEAEIVATLICYHSKTE